jgi:hypothetical protein
MSAAADSQIIARRFQDVLAKAILDICLRWQSVSNSVDRSCLRYIVHKSIPEYDACGK